MSAMHQAVQDGISQGRIADDLMPVIDWHLGGDQGGFDAVPVFQEFQEI